MGLGGQDTASGTRGRVGFRAVSVFVKPEKQGAIITE